MDAKIDTERLVAEFSAIGLTAIDARRSAFCALACHQGWNAARIGRYLGISRARVGQRIDRLRKYAETRADMPLLSALLASASPPAIGSATGLPVGFTLASWDDPLFAQGMIDQLAA